MPFRLVYFPCHSLVALRSHSPALPHTNIRGSRDLPLLPSRPSEMTPPSLLQLMVHGNSSPGIYQVPVLAGLLLSSPAWQLGCEWDVSSFLSYLEFLSQCLCAVGTWDGCAWKSLLQLSPRENCPFWRACSSYPFFLLPIYPGITMGSVGDKEGAEPCCDGTQVPRLVPAVSRLLLLDSLVALMHRGFEQ